MADAIAIVDMLKENDFIFLLKNLRIKELLYHLRDSGLLLPSGRLGGGLLWGGWEGASLFIFRNAS
jgi:hypothetical protein